MEPAFPGAANCSAVADANNAAAAAPAQAPIREQDRLMPIANVIRIMRRVLPAHAKISDDAKETIQECVSEYISFITGEANERCQREQRKTITAEDVLWAMSRLGFDDYVEPLSVYLHRYREFEGEARGLGAGAAARGDHHSMTPALRTRAPMVAHHEMQQMHTAMYGSTVHGFVMPPHHGQFGQYELYGGEHGMPAYYGAVYGASAAGGGSAGADGSAGGGGGASTSHEPLPVMAPNFEHQHQFGYK